MTRKNIFPISFVNRQKHRKSIAEILAIVVMMFLSCTAKIELYDTSLMGNWTIMQPFPGSERAYTASFVLQLDGREFGYVACGHNGSGCLSEVFRYDPFFDSWTKQAEFEGDARTHAVGFACNGKGYVGTGWDGIEKVMRDFWEFDPVDEYWKEVAPLPDEADERHSAIAFSLFVNGKEYGFVGCGYTNKENIVLVLKDFWRFDPDGVTPKNDGSGEDYKGAWERVVGYPGDPRWGGTAFVIDNKAYICLGFTNTTNNNLLEFDPNNGYEGGKLIGTWTEKRKMYNAEPNEKFDDEYDDLARGYAASFTMPGGNDGRMKGYIATGLGKCSVWEYNPIEDLWVQRTRHFSNAKDGYEIKEGATGFSFLNVHPKKDYFGRAFVCLGEYGAVPYNNNRAFFPNEKDNIHDD